LRDAAKKLAEWFAERRNDAFPSDVSERLADALDESRDRDEDLPPRWISLEAGMGLSEFTVPAAVARPPV
jgi:hypothetical protein